MESNATYLTHLVEFCARVPGRIKPRLLEQKMARSPALRRRSDRIREIRVSAAE